MRRTLQLLVWLREEWEHREERTRLLELVRDAARLLTADEDALGWGSDLTDWLRAAAPFVRS